MKNYLIRKYPIDAVSCLVIGYPVLSSEEGTYWEYSHLIGQLVKNTPAYPSEANRQKARTVFLNMFPEIKKMIPRRINNKTKAREVCSLFIKNYGEEFVFKK